MTPEEYSHKIYNMIWHSAMGTGWDRFIKDRAIKIIEHMKELDATPPNNDPLFFDKTIKILKCI